MIASHIKHGISTFDMGDIYTGVEMKLGEYIQTNKGTLEIHTKLVPDLDQLPHWDASTTNAVVRRSLNRLGLECVHLIQFHWWDWGIGNHVDVYESLVDLRDKGLVSHVGVTNYDAKHMQELLDKKLPVHCNQIQYSLLDRRVEPALVPLCRARGVRLLCYGVLAGGFLSDKWLGVAEPVMEDLPTRSLVKYFLVVKEFGGWARLQELLAALRKTADAHGDCDIATLAQAWVLSRPAVGGLIVGLSDASRTSSCATRALELSCRLIDWTDVNQVLEKADGPAGPVYELERQREGPHGKIMRYTCSQLHSQQHAAEFAKRAALWATDGSRCTRAALLEEYQGFPTPLKNQLRLDLKDVLFASEANTAK